MLCLELAYEEQDPELKDKAIDRAITYGVNSQIEIERILKKLKRFSSVDNPKNL